MKIYSRDIFEQKTTMEDGRIITRKVCAPCAYEPCKPLEVDDPKACRCKTQFIDETGKIIGLCECFASHNKHIKIR